MCREERILLYIVQTIPFPQGRDFVLKTQYNKYNYKEAVHNICLGLSISY